MKPTPSDQVSEKRSAYKAGDRVRVQWSQHTQRIVSLHPHAAYAVFESDVTGLRRESPLFDITGLVVSVINPGAQPAPVPSPEIKVGDWVRLKAQPDRDGIVIEIRESGTIVVLELVQRKASRPFDAVALQAWSSAVEHVPVKPGPAVYPHGMGASPPTLSPKARRLKQLEGEIATGILELLIVSQQPPTVETLRDVTAQAKAVVRANAMFALTKLLPEGLFA